MIPFIGYTYEIEVRLEVHTVVVYQHPYRMDYQSRWHRVTWFRKSDQWLISWVGDWLHEHKLWGEWEIIINRGA